MSSRFSLFVLFSCFAGQLFAQTTYLPLQTNSYPLIDRLETRSGMLGKRLFSTVKPVSRRELVAFLLEQQAQADSNGLTEIDRYNIEQQISMSGEWTPAEDGAIDSKKPLFGRLYRKQPDLLHIKTDNFFLAANPVISAAASYETATDFSGKLLQSTRGVELRGWIAKKVGFYTFFSDSQDQLPSYVRDWVYRYAAVPGTGYYKDANPSHFDYLQGRGYIDFAAVKDHINVSFGHDKHFYGDGIRSLFLSDFPANTTFLRINTKIWKLNYQNLFLELVPNYQRSIDYLYPKKYAAIHQLDFNVNRWLNIGLFESVVFARKDRFEFGYLIPLIFYRAVQRQLGDPDNANVGLSFKAVAAKHLQFYGQFMLDDFTAKQFFSRNGYWANKYGVQLGMKYFDAFTVKNLDLQGEVNIVRPYTYSHYDSIGNYTHYNQPLAHPLGANFAELIGNIRYQPVKKLFIDLRGIYYQQGVDTGAANYGSDVFRNYFEATSVTSDSTAWMFNHGLLSGVKVGCITLNMNIGYEVHPNMFLEFGFSHRRYEHKSLPVPEKSSTWAYFGFRANIARRDFNFR